MMKTQNMNQTNAGFTPSQAEAVEFLAAQQLCVVSTIDQTSHPNSATVAFSVTAGLEFIIGTSQTSRKARNIGQNQKVAINITDPERRYTVQAEGMARELTLEEFAAYEDEHYRQLPGSLPFKDAPGQTHFLITPLHVRFSDCSSYPWVLTDFNF